MKADIDRHGPQSLFEDRSGMLIHALVGSKAEAVLEQNVCFTRIGVYKANMKLADVLADIGD